MVSIHFNSRRKRICYCIGLVCVALYFLPYLILQGDSSFIIGDFLDDEVVLLRLGGKYFFTGFHTVVEEILAGTHLAAIQPDCFLLVWPIYWFGSLPGVLFILAMDLFAAYTGFYLFTQKLLRNQYPVYCMLCGVLFIMLPFYPQYGMSVMGFPLIAWAFWNLREHRRIRLSYFLIGMYALSSSPVWSGYIVLGVVLCWILGIRIRRKEKVKLLLWGLVELLLLYILVYKDTFYNILFSGVTSHRNDPLRQYSYADFKSSFVELFKYGQFHAASYHTYIMAGSFVLLVGIGIWMKVKNKTSFVEELRRMWIWGSILWGSGLVIAVFAAFYNTEGGHVVRKYMGVFESVQLDRVYWVYPALWYVELVICGVLIFTILRYLVKKYEWNKRLLYLIPMGELVVFLFMGIYLFGKNDQYRANLYRVVGKETGTLTFNQYYDYDVMKQVREAIGKPQNTYRVASVGMAPAVASENGFYTIDAYVNNYDLQYKYQFRKVIEKELDKSDTMRSYYDNWGSRVYVFSSELGMDWNLGKKNIPPIESLNLNTEALAELNCQYILSATEIRNAEETGLHLMGVFDTETSYRTIWLYEVESAMRQ